MEECFMEEITQATGRFTQSTNGKDYRCGGAPLSASGSRWSAILYRPPYGLTGWTKWQTGQEVVLRTVTLHLPTNMPPPLHPEVIICIPRHNYLPNRLFAWERSWRNGGG
jgi:hypothetical protein